MSANEDTFPDVGSDFDDPDDSEDDQSAADRERSSAAPVGGSNDDDDDSSYDPDPTPDDSFSSDDDDDDDSGSTSPQTPAGREDATANPGGSAGDETDNTADSTPTDTVREQPATEGPDTLIRDPQAGANAPEPEDDVLSTVPGEEALAQQVANQFDDVTRDEVDISRTEIGGEVIARVRGERVGPASQFGSGGSSGDASAAEQAALAGEVFGAVGPTRTQTQTTTVSASDQATVSGAAGRNVGDAAFQTVSTTDRGVRSPDTRAEVIARGRTRNGLFAPDRAEDRPAPNPITGYLREQTGLPSQREVTADLRAITGIPSLAGVNRGIGDATGVNPQRTVLSGQERVSANALSAIAGGVEAAQENPVGAVAAGAPVAFAEPTPLGEAGLLAGAAAGALGIDLAGRLESGEVDRDPRSNPLVGGSEVGVPEERPAEQSELDPQQPVQSVEEVSAGDGDFATSEIEAGLVTPQSEVAVPRRDLNQDPLVLDAQQAAGQVREEEDEEQSLLEELDEELARVEQNRGGEFVGRERGEVPYEPDYGRIRERTVVSDYYDAGDGSVTDELAIDEQPADDVAEQPLDEQVRREFEDEQPTQQEEAVQGPVQQPECDTTQQPASVGSGGRGGTVPLIGARPLEDRDQTPTLRDRVQSRTRTRSDQPSRARLQQGQGPQFDQPQPGVNVLTEPVEVAEGDLFTSDTTTTDVDIPANPTVFEYQFGDPVSPSNPTVPGNPRTPRRPRFDTDDSSQSRSGGSGLFSGVGVNGRDPLAANYVAETYATGAEPGIGIDAPVPTDEELREEVSGADVLSGTIPTALGLVGDESAAEAFFGRGGSR